MIYEIREDAAGIFHVAEADGAGAICTGEYGGLLEAQAALEKAAGRQLEFEVIGVFPDDLSDNCIAAWSCCW